MHRQPNDRVGGAGSRAIDALRVQRRLSPQNDCASRASAFGRCRQAGGLSDCGVAMRVELAPFVQALLPQLPDPSVTAWPDMLRWVCDSG